MFLLNPESPNNEAHLYQEFNAICHRISLALIILMEQKKIIGHRTFDFQKLIQNDMYKKLLERVGNELKLNNNLIAICEKMQITFSELIDLLTDSEEDFFTLFPQWNVL
jgi:hypothetical protein